MSPRQCYRGNQGGQYSGMGANAGLHAVRWAKRHRTLGPVLRVGEMVAHARDGVGGWRRHLAYVIIDRRATEVPDETRMDRRIPLGSVPPVKCRFWGTMTCEWHRVQHRIATGGAIPTGTLHAYRS